MILRYTSLTHSTPLSWHYVLNRNSWYCRFLRQPPLAACCFGLSAFFAVGRHRLELYIPALARSQWTVRLSQLQVLRLRPNDGKPDKKLNTSGDGLKIIYICARVAQRTTYLQPRTRQLLFRDAATRLP